MTKKEQELRRVKCPNHGRGFYNATRAEWQAAYRRARVLYAQGVTRPVLRFEGIDYGACCVVCWHRRAEDWLACPVRNRLLIEQVFKEVNDNA